MDRRHFSSLTIEIEGRLRPDFILELVHIMVLAGETAPLLTLSKALV